jgi:hypothetical protein
MFPYVANRLPDVSQYHSMDIDAPGLNHHENLKPHYLTVFSHSFG